MRRIGGNPNLKLGIKIIKWCTLGLIIFFGLIWFVLSGFAAITFNWLKLLWVKLMFKVLGLSEPVALLVGIGVLAVIVFTIAGLSVKESKRK